MAIQGGAGQMGQDMVKELQKLQQKDQMPDAGKQGEGGAKFGQALQNNSHVSEAQNLQKMQETSKASSTLQAAQASKMNQASHVSQSQRVTEASKTQHSQFKGVVKELMAGQNKMEDLMKVAMSGQKLNNQEMLGIQAGVHMFSQQMELTSKVIEKATSGIKQMLNTQL